MKIKKLYFYAILISLFFGCTRPSDKQLAVDEEMNKTANELEQEKELELVGTGAQMMNAIDLLDIEFYYYHLVTLEEARELIIYASQTFLNNINSNKKIRPYLHEYPFKPKDIEVVIYMFTPDRNRPPQEDIDVVRIYNGMITYKTSRPSRSSPHPVLKEESYEEALKLVQESSQNAQKDV